MYVDIKYLANTYLLFALLLGALLPVMLDIGTSISTYEFLFLAYAVSIPTSLLFVLATGNGKKLVRYLSNKHDFAIIASIGLLNYAFLEFGLSYAERFVSSSLATIVYRTYPILMLLFVPFVLHERITKYQLGALCLAFVGLYIAIGGGTLQLFSGANMGIILFLIVVALAGALATVLVKRYVYDMETSMFIFNLANFAFFTLLFIYNGMPTSHLTCSRPLS